MKMEYEIFCNIFCTSYTSSFPKTISYLASRVVVDKIQAMSMETISRFIDVCDLSEDECRLVCYMICICKSINQMEKLIIKPVYAKYMIASMLDHNFQDHILVMAKNYRQQTIDVFREVGCNYAVITQLLMDEFGGRFW